MFAAGSGQGPDQEHGEEVNPSLHGPGRDAGNSFCYEGMNVLDTDGLLMDAHYRVALHQRVPDSDARPG